MYVALPSLPGTALSDAVSGRQRAGSGTWGVTDGTNGEATHMGSDPGSCPWHSVLLVGSSHKEPQKKALGPSLRTSRFTDSEEMEPKTKRFRRDSRLQGGEASTTAVTSSRQELPTSVPHLCENHPGA